MPHSFLTRVLPEKWETVMAKPCAKEADKKHDKHNLRAVLVFYQNWNGSSHQDLGRSECAFW